MSMFERDTYQGCSSCYGRGTHINWETGNEDGPCGACRGTGRELTEVGHQLMEFLEQHYDLKPKENQ